MIEVGTVLQNRYQVQQKIGAGGMGTVYLANDQRFDSPVAIKETHFADDDLRKAFEREAQLLNRMRHPALPRVIDYFAEDDHQFLVMEYIAGADLSAILKQTGAFPVAQVLKWADELLGALEYLHSQKPPVIHRDIKPQNLKMTPGGEIILLDFGLAKGKTGDTSRLSITNSVFGYSRSYAPLEQIQGTGTDLRSDIYSLAATVYHLFTGKPPIDALTRATAYVNDQTDPLPPVNKINRQVPPEVAEVLQRALELNASLRLPSASEMRQALREAAQKSDSTQIITATPHDDDNEATQIVQKNRVAAPLALPIVEQQANFAPKSEAPTISQPIAPENQASAAPESAISVETPPRARRAAFGRSRTIEQADEQPRSFAKAAGLAAAIVILGGAAFAWYATSRPAASSQPKTAITVDNQNANAAAVASPANRKTDTIADAPKTASNTNSSVAATTATFANSSAAQNQTATQTVEAKRPDSATVRSNSSAAKTTEENVAAEDEQQQESTAAEEPARPAPSPIIVKSAPPTDNRPRKANRDDEERQNENQKADETAPDNDEPPPLKRPNKPEETTDEAPPAAKRRRPEGLADSRERRVNENRQALPRILGAPR